MSSFLSPETYDRIFLRDDFLCHYCGFDGKASIQNWMQLSVDHIIPKRFGEDNSDNNLVTCCISCNSKTNRIPSTNKFSRKQIKEKKQNYIQNELRSYRDRWVRSTQSRTK
jgi:5-methylcytosine-specific restriction endonuclease McrA